MGLLHSMVPEEILTVVGCGANRRVPHRTYRSRPNKVELADAALGPVAPSAMTERSPATCCHPATPSPHRLRDAQNVLFGPTCQPASSRESASWLSGVCSTRPWTVGGLLPARYETVIRLHAPDQIPGDWWDLYRRLFDMVASIGASHTTTPDLAWFAVWEGHGFGVSSGEMVWTHPPAHDEEGRAREASIERNSAAVNERNARVGPALAAVPRIALDDRSYFLLEGPLSGLNGLRYPDDDVWRNPDLFWPDDRSWFAATDVDFWSLYVAGRSGFTRELARSATTSTEIVDRGDALPIEN